MEKAKLVIRKGYIDGTEISGYYLCLETQSVSNVELLLGGFDGNVSYEVHQRGPKINLRSHREKDWAARESYEFVRGVAKRLSEELGLELKSDLEEKC